MDAKFRKYILLWLSQSVSGIGSSMTGFALVLWAYGQSHSAMSVSLISFCNYVPYVFLSLFVGKIWLCQVKCVINFGRRKFAANFPV